MNTYSTAKILYAFCTPRSVAQCGFLILSTNGVHPLYMEMGRFLYTNMQIAFGSFDSALSDNNLSCRAINIQFTKDLT